MKYKALLCDVDGTLVLNDGKTMPSTRIQKAVTNSRQYLHIGIATSRPIFLLHSIVSHLKLSGPSVINAGAEIVDFTTGQILTDFPIQKDILKELITIMESLNLQIRIDDGKSDMEYHSDRENKRILKVFTLGNSEDLTNILIRKTARFNTLTLHKTPSWKTDSWDIFFTDIAASKENGVAEVANLLGISSQEIIGIGDGHNDISFLKACGLKIAMGNATNEVKEIADFIVPSVEDDGVAVAIEKYILNNND